jgi:hypothetical protein
MQLIIFVLSFLSLSSALPQPFVKRDASTLLATINDLNSAVTELTTAVNSFDGSLLGLLPQALAVVKAEAEVDITILKATHIAETSANYTAAESTEIVETLATQIGPIQDSLNALKAKVCYIACAEQSPC